MQQPLPAGARTWRIRSFGRTSVVFIAQGIYQSPVTGKGFSVVLSPDTFHQARDLVWLAVFLCDVPVNPDNEAVHSHACY
jgi:hypothetical protein